MLADIFLYRTYPATQHIDKEGLKMKLFIFAIGVSLTVLFGHPLQTAVKHLETCEKEIPRYAKWGLLAVKETKLKYTEAQVVDYLHKGRVEKGNETTEMFKLWLKGKEREFGVFVNITFETNTEEVLNISFTETDH